MLEGCINGLAAVSIQKESIELKFKFNAFESNVSIQPEFSGIYIWIAMHPSKYWLRSVDMDSQFSLDPVQF